jgi:hypothetical protein
MPRRRTKDQLPLPFQMPPEAKKLRFDPRVKTAAELVRDKTKPAA